MCPHIEHFFRVCEPRSGPSIERGPFDDRRKLPTSRDRQSNHDALGARDDSMGCGSSSPAGGMSEAAVTVAGPSVAITVKSVPDHENRGRRYVIRHCESGCIAHYQIGKWDADADLAVLARLTDPDEPGATLGAKDVPSLAEIVYETKITLKRPPMGAAKFTLEPGDVNVRGRGECGYELTSPKLDVDKEHAGYHALMWVKRDGKKASRLVAVKKLDGSVKKLNAGEYPDPEDPIRRSNFLGTI